MTRKRHKSTGPPPTPDKLKQAYAILNLRAMQRAEESRSPIELKFDATPEGLVAFSKYIVELVGLNKLDLGRASTINGILQTIIRTSESGLDAVHEIEENTRILEETLRTTQPQTRRVTS